MGYLTAIVTVQNEARYLPQWVEYHIGQGFDKFVIYDNNSHPIGNPRKALWPYGNVEIIKVPPLPKGTLVGHWSLDQAKSIKSTWLWAGSVDEYFYCPCNMTVAGVLKDYETPEIASLRVSWLLFNSLGPTDNGLVIERFTHAVHDQIESIKSIARQGHYEKWPNSHSVIPLPGKVNVNELFHPGTGPRGTEFTEKRIVIFHYRTMSRKEWDWKMAKGHAIAGEHVPRYEEGKTWEVLHTKPWIERKELTAKGSWLRGQLLKRYRLI